MTITGQHRSEIRCPVSGCSWSLDTTPPAVSEGALAEVFGWGVVAATRTAQALRDNEMKAEAHLKSHTVVEWITTVNELRDAYAGAIGQVIELSQLLGQQPPPPLSPDSLPVRCPRCGHDEDGHETEDGARLCLDCKGFCSPKVLVPAHVTGWAIDGRAR